ncbi:HNH endonuclease [Nocardioides KLBMP 9356]|uniref:HNH endonuclease n=1 Tax=Nocardioides potassii TaxID=2911371 RepID=A0ABS9H8C8_9ACTN|nr:HNH endonuclease signature motif containing protein [Nocardioides potassii]MCF6377467.1 HNH endonuclease [Nocardioides potassii]
MADHRPHTPHDTGRSTCCRRALAAWGGLGPVSAVWLVPGDGSSSVVDALLGRLDGVLDDFAALSPGGLVNADVVRLLDAATVAANRVASLQCRTVAEADRRRLGDAIGERHTHQWWAGRSRLTRSEAGRLTKLGVALDEPRHADVARRLADGMLCVEQARAIVEAVEALPPVVDDEVRDRAEDALLELARQHDARDLKQLGKRILDAVAPEVGESHEAKRLEDEERRAAEASDFTLYDDGEGRCHGWFTVPTHVGTILRRTLLALANPARHGAADLRDASGEWKPSRRRMGEAFIEYVERYPLDAMPQTAGVNATVVVTMTLQDLLGEHATALLDDGSRMSAAQARRLACEAGIIPAVLGGKSQPLDLGRARRLFNKAQRIALGVRDRRCTAKGCETTASGCHAHHDDPWSRGGRTDLVNGRLLCPHHHRLAHDPRYAMTVHTDNKVTFVMRT